MLHGRHLFGIMKALFISCLISVCNRRPRARTAETCIPKLLCAGLSREVVTNAGFDSHLPELLSCIEASIEEAIQLLLNGIFREG